VPHEIYGLVIPKYGMVMKEGLISKWHLNEGDTVNQGDELVDIETEKVANVYESPHSGVLKRKVVPEGRSVPIGSLFGVIASKDTADAEIEAYVEQFESTFSVADAEEGGAIPEVVDVPGGYIRFLKQGQGAAVPAVLIHGFGADLNSWLLNQAALADSRPVYAIDLPGHGGSVKDPRIATLEDIAQAVIAFLEAKSLSSVHLIGHSLGGAVAAKIAAERPALVKSLTLIAPAGLGKEINFSFIRALVDIDRRKDMATALETLFYNPALVSRDMTMGVLNAKRIDGAVTCLRAIATGCFGSGEQKSILRDQISQLPLPVQVIWGQSDRVIPPQHAQELPGKIRVHPVEHAGHAVQLEKAGEINRLLSHFIDQG